MKPLRIVNAMFGRSLGGIEQALLDYHDALSMQGCEVHNLISPDAAILPALRSRGADVRLLPHLGHWDPLAAFRLRRWLKRLAPDAVIAHGNRAASLLRRARPACPIIGVAHNYSLHPESVDAILCPTRDLLRHYTELGMDRAHLQLAPNMVRLAGDEPDRQWHKPPVLGALGRMVAKKGFPLFLDALAELKTRGVAFRAIIAGDGEDREALTLQATKLGLADQVSFPGWATDTQAFFAGIDVFCLPSHHEPFGIVLLEAMAAALPVVSTDSEGPREILQDGVNGLLVPRDDPHALTDALAALLCDPRRAELLSRNAFETVQREYDIRVAGPKLALALRSLCRL